MIDCTFNLDGQPISAFKMNTLQFPAYSGLGNHANRSEFACNPDLGPIPPGVYYILDRQSGGRLGPLRDFFIDRSEWFALYAADGNIDDETFCNRVKRGNFRLHPSGAAGISRGCITIQNHADFNIIRTHLRASKQIDISGSSLTAYGRVTVK